MIGTDGSHYLRLLEQGRAFAADYQPYKVIPVHALYAVFFRDPAVLDFIHQEDHSINPAKLGVAAEQLAIETIHEYADGVRESERERALEDSILERAGLLETFSRKAQPRAEVADFSLEYIQRLRGLDVRGVNSNLGIFKALFTDFTPDTYDISQKLGLEKIRSILVCDKVGPVKDRALINTTRRVEDTGASPSWN